ncbi:hypothetical protein SDJN02_22859, partial [Cucurbita argyrosperma subsp. argyrosperma]
LTSFPHRVVGEAIRRQVLSQHRQTPQYNNDLPAVTVKSHKNNKTPPPFIVPFSTSSPSILYCYLSKLLPLIHHQKSTIRIAILSTLILKSPVDFCSSFV